MSGTLTLVGTPIGNLSDFSPRAVEALSACDFIAAEDTRVTLRLLNHFGVKKPLVSYYEQNKRQRGEQICARLLAGENGVLVSDAGMPAISDPGEDLVRLCHERGIKVEAVPGPCAFATALAVSGMPSRRFSFEGFLPADKNDRRRCIEKLAGNEHTLIFYEAPHKLAAALADLAAILGDRRLAIVRELTKIHEQVILTTLCAAAEKYSAEELKGEIVLIIDGAPETSDEPMTLDEAVELARRLVEGGESKTNAAKLAAKESGIKKGDIYQALV